MQLAKLLHNILYSKVSRTLKIAQIHVIMNENALRHDIGMSRRAFI